MAARTSQEEHKRRRRKKLIRGLLLGGAAVGLPALANALLARHRPRLTAPVWGRPHLYAWRYGECSFRRLGEGDPVVLLHSFGAGHDSEEWRAVAEALAPRHRVLALDLLGWGRSEKPRLTYDAELYLQLVADFLEDVVGQRAAIVAAGLPAAYAVQVAVDEPEKVHGLALVAPGGIGVGSDQPDLKDALVHRLLRLPVLGTSALNLYTSRAALAQQLKREVGESPEQADAARVEHLYRSSHQSGGHAPLAAYLSGYLNHRVDGILGRLQAPLWVGWGRHATSPAVETADRWLQHAPEAEIEVFEEAGNQPHVEQAGLVARRLGTYLSRLAA